jgi:muconolactone D-isomerase
MEFLVRIEVRWPPTGDPGERDRLIADERRRAGELAAAGHLLRLWRVPGRWANVGIWAVADATALHELLASLPFFPYIDVAVEPLASHPSDPGA